MSEPTTGDRERAIPMAAAPATATAAGQGDDRRDLHDLVESLAEQALPKSTTSDDSAAASRILVAANDAAEQLLAAARGEAATLVETARARTTELLAVAQKLADTELRAERARVAGAVETWNEQRGEIAVRLAKAQSSLATYQADAADAMAAITDAMSELDSIAPAADSSVAEPAPDESAAVEDRAYESGASDVGEQRTSLFVSPAASGPDAANSRSGLFGR